VNQLLLLEAEKQVPENETDREDTHGLEHIIGAQKEMQGEHRYPVRKRQAKEYPG
jgi:hypothetical protein